MADKQERILRAFKRGHSPDLVAKAVIDAVERNRELVPVGIEAKLAYGFARVAPGTLRGLLARAQPL